MLIALRPTSRLSLAGQTSTQRPQPVQSSGETWTRVLRAREARGSVAFVLLKVGGRVGQQRRVVDLRAG